MTVEYLAPVIPSALDLSWAVIEAVTRTARSRLRWNGCKHMEAMCEHYADYLDCQRQEALIEDYTTDCALFEAAAEAEAEERAMQSQCPVCKVDHPCEHYRAWQERVNK